MQLQRLSNGQLISLGDELGSGGEARVYGVQQNRTLAAKLYHRPMTTHIRKLAAMISNPPEDPMASNGHVSIAWPLDLLRTVDGDEQIVGFLMPFLENLSLIANICNPGVRRQQFPGFDYRYLHRTARNLAAVINAVHARGYVVGDVNESNTLVTNTALVTMIDTDSFQVRDPQNGEIYRCRYGMPGFTPPELLRLELGTIDRYPAHDHFGLAVLIFQLLMEGIHPFAGIFTGDGEPPSQDEKIASGYFPYSRQREMPFRPSPHAPLFDALHPTLQDLFVLCFEEGHDHPENRPEAATWQEALEVAEDALIPCAANPQHHYGNHLKTCPWCDRAAQLGGHDTFSPQTERRKPKRKTHRSTEPTPTSATPPRPFQTASPNPQSDFWAKLATVLKRSIDWKDVQSLPTLLVERFSPQPSQAPQPLIPVTERVNPKDGATMLYIPAGEFIMGTSDDQMTELLSQFTNVDYTWFEDEMPQHEVNLDGYWIYKYPVTVAQYRRFSEDTGREMPSPPSWDWHDDHPVVNVAWHDAIAYCRWAGVRLPTEAQWEKAARSGDGRIWPWGNIWDSSKCNSGERLGQTNPVGSYPYGASPYGLMDMAGNVWEWCMDEYNEDFYENSPRNNPVASSPEFNLKARRVLRGGSWVNEPSTVSAAVRYGVLPYHWNINRGFRCASPRFPQ